MTTIATPPLKPNPTPSHRVDLMTALASRDARISFGDQRIAYEDEGRQCISPNPYFRVTTISAGGKTIFQNRFDGHFLSSEIRASKMKTSDVLADIQQYARLLGRIKSGGIMLALQENALFDGQTTQIADVISAGSTITMCGNPLDIKLGVDYKTLMKITGDSANRLGLADFRVSLKSGGETATLVDPTNTFVIVANHKPYTRDGAVPADFVKVLYVDPRITAGQTLHHESLKEGYCIRGRLAVPLAYALVSRVSNALSGW